MNTLTTFSLVPLETFNKKKLNVRYDLNPRIQYPLPMQPSAYPDLRLIVLRHAERVDTKFGDDWYKRIFQDQAQAPDEAYNNPFLPARLPHRKPTFHYLLDPPITRSGQNKSIQKGAALSRLYGTVDACFSSPASRSVLTADAVLEGMRSRQVPINLEPFLFEPMTWNTALQQYQHISPCLNRYEWGPFRFNINTEYQRVSKFLNPMENENEYFERVWKVAQQKILNPYSLAKSQRMRYNRSMRPTTTILILGHAATPATFRRLLVTGKPDLPTLNQECERTDFLRGYVLDRNPSTGTWSVSVV